MNATDKTATTCNSFVFSGLSIKNRLHSKTATTATAGGVSLACAHVGQLHNVANFAVEVWRCHELALASAVGSAWATLADDFGRGAVFFNGGGVG